MLNWWYGTSNKKEPEPEPEALDIMDQLETQIETLTIKKMKLLQKANEKKNEAKQNPTRARQLLIQCKQYENLASQLDGQIMNLEQTSMGMESAASANDIVNGMKSAQKETSKMLQQVNVDEVDQVMADLGDQSIDIQEANNLLSQPIGGSTVDEDLEDEITKEIASWGETKEPELNLPDLPIKNNNNNNNGNKKVLIKE